MPVGLASVLAGAIAGAVAAYLIARQLGRAAVRRVAGARLERIDDAVTRCGYVTILVARLIPVVPFTTINYVAGLTGISLRAFTAATILGILPATTAYVVLGAYDTRPGAWPFWAALGTLAVLTAGTAATALRRHRSRNPPTGRGH